MTPFDKPAFRGLLADVVTNVADDTPRLVLADWLEDHGQEARAEFIRVQVEQARLEAIPHICVYGDWDAESTCAACGMHPEQARLDQRAHELLTSDQELWPGHLCFGALGEGLRIGRYAWAGAVAELSDPGGEGWHYRRGFVHSVRWGGLISHRMVGVFWHTLRDRLSRIVACQPLEAFAGLDFVSGGIEASSYPKDLQAELGGSRISCGSPQAALRHFTRGVLAWARKEAVKQGLLPEMEAARG